MELAITIKYERNYCQTTPTTGTPAVDADLVPSLKGNPSFLWPWSSQNTYKSLSLDQNKVDQNEKIWLLASCCLAVVSSVAIMSHGILGLCECIDFFSVGIEFNIQRHPSAINLLGTTNAFFHTIQIIQSKFELVFHDHIAPRFLTRNHCRK